MRIREISWENYRSLGDASIHVRRHLVLVGPNDSGKSSVLRAINLSLGASASQLAAALEPGDFRDPDAALRFRLTLDGIEDSDRAAFPDEISTEGGEVLAIALEATMSGGEAEQIQIQRYFPDSGHSRPPSRAQMEQLQWMYVAATRSLSRELGAASSGAVRTLLSTIDLDPDRAAFDEATDAFRVALEQSAAISDFRADLAAALTDSLPRAVRLQDLHLSSEAELLQDPLASVTVTVSDGTRQAPLSEQSDGIRALAVLTLLGMSRKGARIVGVDEPEGHLHHGAQRSVASRFRESAAQNILVTHSAAVMREMDPLDVVVMGADRAARQLPEDAAIAKEEAIRRHWIPNLIEPLTARAVLLVEGPTDRILCERTAQLIGVDLNRRSVSLFEMDGSGLFERAYELFGPAGFDLPVFGLLDADAREEWAQICKLDVKQLHSGHGFEVCDPDLEGMYITQLGVERVKELLLASSHFSTSALQRASATGRIDDLTAEELAVLCKHRKRKVRAALAVASGLTEDEATTLTPLVNIVRAACV